MAQRLETSCWTLSFGLKVVIQAIWPKHISWTLTKLIIDILHTLLRAESYLNRVAFNRVYSVENNLRLLCFCFTSVFVWLTKCAPFWKPNKQTKTNPRMHTCIFPRLALGACNYFKFWLVHVALCIFCDWSDWLLWIWLYDTRLKATLTLYIETKTYISSVYLEEIETFFPFYENDSQRLGNCMRLPFPQAIVLGWSTAPVNLRSSCCCSLCPRLTVKPRAPCFPPFTDEMQRCLGTKQLENRIL